VWKSLANHPARFCMASGRASAFYWAALIACAIFSIIVIIAELLIFSPCVYTPNEAVEKFDQKACFSTPQ
jgi:hypothetical protein